MSFLDQKEREEEGEGEELKESKQKKKAFSFISIDINNSVINRSVLIHSLLNNVAHNEYDKNLVQRKVMMFHTLVYIYHYICVD
jgi:hypothetical protein